MAKKRMKAYLPRWTLAIVMPVLAMVWGLITYQTFATPQGLEDPGVLGWLGVTAVLLLVGIMLWLMASGRLPAYIIEVDDEDDSPSEV